MQYFPIFLDLNNKPVLVVGGGNVACRKMELLIKAGALVTVVSPSIHADIAKSVEDGRCGWLQAFYSEDILLAKPPLLFEQKTSDSKAQSHSVKRSYYRQVWATTDNPDLNHKVYQDAQNHGVAVNVADDLPYCDFITPTMINRGRIQIAISSGGASPVLIRRQREKLESILPQNLSMLAEFAVSKRNDIKQKYPNIALRRQFWEAFFELPLMDTVKERKELELVYQQLLDEKSPNPSLLLRHTQTWIEFSYDVELLSIKALRLMQQADKILYPPTCSMAFVELCRRDADKTVFTDLNHLNQCLAQAEKELQRVCIFIPQHSTEFALLSQSHLLLSLPR